MAEGEQVAKGNLATIDLNQRFFTLSDKDHKIFIRIEWKSNGKPYDDFMAKQKIGYYQEAKYVVQNDKNILTLLPFVDRPADFPKIPKSGGSHSGGQSSGGGWKGGSPKDDTLILYQVLFKSLTELRISMGETGYSKPFDETAKEITVATTVAAKTITEARKALDAPATAPAAQSGADKS